MHSPFFSHIQELRRRLFICTVTTLFFILISYFFYETWVALFSKPFVNLDLVSHPFYVKSILEGALLKLKFSLLFGVIFSLPMYLYHGLKFSIPGLQTHEIRILILTILSSAILAIASFSYGYFIMLPLVIQFLMSHHFIPSDVGILLTLSDNLLYVFNIIAYLIVIFQFPIVVLLLLYFKVITRSLLLRFSRYVIVGIFIASAILTPPDVVSQILLSVPLILLFFLVILISSIFKVGSYV